MQKEKLIERMNKNTEYRIKANTKTQKLRMANVSSRRELLECQKDISTAELHYSYLSGGNLFPEWLMKHQLHPSLYAAICLV